jgi:nickel superoxide dismutase
MSRSVPSFVSRAVRALDRLAPPLRAEAHCDIPCGIYDPHFAQLAALSVIRMNQLINNLQAGGNDKAGMDVYANSFSRYVAVKEEHAEIVKREVRIIWGDYFKPEHAEKYPELHQLTWDIMKLASKSRQEVNLQAAEELLGKLHRFSEIFWETKGVATKKQPSNQAAGGEYVVPAN